MCDKSVLVTAPEDLKIKRVMERDNVTAAQVKARMDKQMSDSDKMLMADHLISNDESQSVISQVYQLHLEFLK